MVCGQGSVFILHPFLAKNHGGGVAQEEKARQMQALEDEVDAANKRFYGERKCVRRGRAKLLAALWSWAGCGVL